MKKSIQEFGYNSYIVVDANYTIIAGHSRFKALQELGYKEIKVIKTYLTEEQVKKYRLVDNKIAENNKWNEKDLEFELMDFKDDELVNFVFSELSDIEVEKPKKQEEIKLNTKINKQTNTDLELDEPPLEDDDDEGKTPPRTPITCPHCLQEFFI